MWQVGSEISGLNPEAASETAVLECERGEWNCRCSGEMRRYLQEHPRRKRLAGSQLTLREKLGEQTGLDTLVVLALNDQDWAWAPYGARAAANALSPAPGEYGRKAETQRN